MRTGTDCRSRYRSLLRFDLSGLGAETSITSAPLSLAVTQTNKLQQAHGNFALKLFLLDNANTDWVQGTKLEHTATASYRPTLRVVLEPKNPLGTLIRVN